MFVWLWSMKPLLQVASKFHHILLYTRITDTMRCYFLASALLLINSVAESRILVRLDVRNEEEIKQCGGFTKHCKVQMSYGFREITPLYQGYDDPYGATWDTTFDAEKYFEDFVSPHYQEAWKYFIRLEMDEDIPISPHRQPDLSQVGWRDVREYIKTLNHKRTRKEPPPKLTYNKEHRVEKPRIHMIFEKLTL